jgi:hypothetical protein
MQLLIFVLVISVANAAPSHGKKRLASSGFVCPTEDIVNTKCLGPKDCLYQNDSDCNSFIQCTVNADGVTGTPVPMPCAPANPPLQWNDNEKVCDYPPSPTCPRKLVYK